MSAANIPSTAVLYILRCRGFENCLENKELPLVHPSCSLSPLNAKTHNVLLMASKGTASITYFYLSEIQQSSILEISREWSVSSRSCDKYFDATVQYFSPSEHVPSVAPPLRFPEQMIWTNHFQH